MSKDGFDDFHFGMAQKPRFQNGGVFDDTAAFLIQFDQNFRDSEVARVHNLQINNGAAAVNTSAAAVAQTIKIFVISSSR